MKLTQEQLEKIIKEEFKSVIDEIGTAGVHKDTRDFKAMFGDDEEGYYRHMQARSELDNPGVVDIKTFDKHANKVFNAKTTGGQTKIDDLFQVSSGQRQPHEQKMFTRDSINAINAVHREYPEMFKTGTYLTDAAFKWISDQNGGMAGILLHMSDNIVNGRLEINIRKYLEVAKKLKTISGHGGSEGSSERSFGQKLGSFLKGKGYKQ